MILKLDHKNFLYLTIIGILLVFALYLSYVGGYGSDEDTLPMIHVFEARLANGTFISSRYTGYPVSEIGIGFLSHFFGSWAANSATFMFYFLGLILTFYSFNKFHEKEKLFLFLILSFSSQVLYFDNIEPIDYSWAFLFFSLGLFFFSRKIFELSVLFFAFAVGCRLNFILFIFVVIFLFKTDEFIPVHKRLIISVCTFITGGLFYLPIWFHYGFGLGWLDAARPVDQGILGLFARFTYKTWMAFGFIQLFFIIYGLLKIKKKLFKKNNILFSFLILSNLLLFLYIPAELSYLQPAIIFLYLFIIREFKKKLILGIIFLNFLNWIINFEFLKINYVDNSICAPKHALSASINFKFTNGAVLNYFDTRKMINCWIDDSTERGKRILKGQSTKLP